MNDKKIVTIEIEDNFGNYMRIPEEYIGFRFYNGVNNGQSEHISYDVIISIDRNYKGHYFDVCGHEHCNSCAITCLRNCQNITIIKHIYEDGSNDVINVNWYDEVLYVKDGRNIYDPKYQNHNEYQRSKSNKHGDLFIVIEPNNRLDKIFPDEVINADDYTVGEGNERVSQ